MINPLDGAGRRRAAHQLDLDLVDRSFKTAREMDYSEASWLLTTVACRLARKTVIAERHPHGLLLRDGLDRVRLATPKERLLHWVFGVLPREI